ncbi:toll/interleukin-1 receptor domain-containing protein [Brevibacillus fluminis]|nr:toll/interleukin-1 receptor domain-containing protein [Brevibacillus fluminis]
MAKGINLANPILTESQRRAFSAKPNNVCVFLSHISIDKDAAIKIGEYIMSTGIDIYLDIYDRDLETAMQIGDPSAITSSIEKGIANSTHIMCIVSPRTVNSWWVPYEIGFGKKSNKKLSTLLLRSTPIPQFLEVTRVLKGIDDLEWYIKEQGGSSQFLLEGHRVLTGTNSKYSHPLFQYLD